MTVIYHRQVPPEVHKACDYYDQECPGLGNQFFGELTDLIERISRHPERWPPLRKGDARRRARLGRFPYSVVYEPRTDHIKVLIVRHHKRRTNYGERRW